MSRNGNDIDGAVMHDADHSGLVRNQDCRDSITHRGNNMKYNWVFASLGFYMGRDIIEDYSNSDMAEDISFNSYLQQLAESDIIL